MIPSRPKEGDKVKVEVYNSVTRKCEWIDGVCDGTVTALDRPYRVSVTLSNGVQIREAAPECIKIVKS